MRSIVKVIVTVIGFSLLPAVAQAHAHLDHAQPATGARLTQAPHEVSLWFTEAIEPKFSSIVVEDTKGRTVQDGKAEGDAGNGAVLKVKLKTLKAGSYKVTWKVLSVDTHRSQGSFSFTVAP